MINLNFLPTKEQLEAYASQQPTEPEPGLFDKIVNSGQAIFEGLKFVPGGAVDTVQDAVFGFDPTDREEMAQRAQTERELQEYRQKYEGKTFDGVTDAMASVPYSLTTMGASLAGGAAGGLTGNPFVAGSASMAASAAVAQRASVAQFERTLYGVTTEALGREPSAEEWSRVNTAFADKASEYGWWEAGPEAISNLLMGKLLKPLGAKFSGGIKDAIKSVAGLYGEELATETITQLGQGTIEAEMGLRDKAPGVVEAFKEVAPATVVQTTLFGMGKKGLDVAYNRMKGKTASQDTISSGADTPPQPVLSPEAGGSLPQGGDAPLELEPGQNIVMGTDRAYEEGTEPPIVMGMDKAYEGPIAPPPPPASPLQQGMGLVLGGPLGLSASPAAPDFAVTPGGQAITAQGAAQPDAFGPIAGGMRSDTPSLSPELEYSIVPEAPKALDKGPQGLPPGQAAAPLATEGPQQAVAQGEIKSDAAPLQLTRINDKSFMLHGDTGPFEAAIKAAGGRLDRKAGGWRFPLAREAEIRERFQTALGKEPTADVSVNAPMAQEEVGHESAAGYDAGGRGVLAGADSVSPAGRTGKAVGVHENPDAGTPGLRPRTGGAGRVAEGLAGGIAETGGTLRHPGRDGGEGGHFEDGLLQGERGGDGESVLLVGDGGRGDGGEGGRLAQPAPERRDGGQPRQPVAIKIPNRVDEPAHYELLEADDVQASHLPARGFQKNPAYGLENERRYHDEPASQAKVMENAARLDPAFLMDSVDANHGAPVVDQDNNVLGGSGRAMSIARAYESFPERGGRYREALKANAGRLGIDPAQVDAMRAPVLVRRLERGLSREERQGLVTAMNDDFKDARERRASGKSRGDRFGRRTLDLLAAGLKEAESLRQYFDTPASAAVVERMMRDGVIQPSERNALVGGDGLLNPDGKKVVEEALRGRVARSYEVLAKLPADVVGKLDAAIPHILVAESIGKPWDITEHVKASVDLLADFKSSGSKDADLYLKQLDMRTGRAPVQDFTKQAIALFRMALDAKKGEYVKAFEKYASNAKMSPEAGGMPGVAKPQDRAFRESFRMEEEAVQSKPEKVKEGKPQAKETSEGQPPEDAFGPAFPAFSGKPKEAIEHLMKVREGHVPAAFHKEGLGDIDLPWGKMGKGGFGLAHIIERRNQSGMDGEAFARSLPTLIRDGRVERRPNYPGRAYIVSEKAETAIRLEWDGKRRNWIVTAYPLNKEALGAVDGLRTSVHAFGDKQSFPLPHSGGVERNISPQKQAVNSEKDSSGPSEVKEGKAEKPRASLRDRTIVGTVTPDMASKLRLNKPGDIILDEEGIHHAEQRHGKEIRSSGFADARELISHVMTNIDAIYQGNNHRTYDLVAKSRNPYARTIVRLEFSPEGDFYRVVTAGPSRQDAYNNKTPLWERAQSDHSLTGTPGAVSGQNGVSGKEDNLKGRKVNGGKASLKKENVRASASTPVAVVDVDPGIVPEFKKARDLAKWLKEYFADKREETILSTGKKVRFGNGNLEASIKRVREAAHNQAYAGLNELVRRAEYDSFEAKDARHPNLGGQEVYYSALRIGDALYAVKFKMDVPSVLELQTRRERRGEKNIEDLRYKDHALREIEMAPVLYRESAHNKVGFTQATGAKEIAPVLYRGVGPNTGGPTQATEAIREISLGVLRDAVKPSRLENGVLSSVKPGEFLNEVPPSRLRVRKAAVQSVADALGKRAANAADTRVVQSFEELPRAVRDVYGHVASQVEGVYDTETDTVYLVADNLRSTGRAAEVWMHENMVHHGLRGLFGVAETRRRLNRLWQGMGGMGNADIAAIARRYGVDPRSDTQGRALVMEEYLASLAEKRAADKLSGQDKTYWRRFVDAVLRAWHALVDAVTGRTGSMKYENVDRLLAALDRYVFEGKPDGMAEGGMVPAMASVDKPRSDMEAAHAAWVQVQRDAEEWGRQVDAFHPHEGTGGRQPRLMAVCRTPDVLQKLGAPDLPMTMTADNLGKVLSDKVDHGLPKELVKQLPRALAEPIMVFESASQADSFVVLTELKHEGRSVMAAVHLDTEKQRVRVNDIASAYKRSNEAWYARQIEEGRLLYQDKKKSLAWARTNRLQLPRVRKLPARLRENRILTEADVVKPIAPEDKPLASLRDIKSVRDITGMSAEDALNLAKNDPWIGSIFGKSDDVTLMQRMFMLPHWMAKRFPGFRAVYDRQLRRQDERAAERARSLQEIPSLFGDDALSRKDMDELKKLVWDHDGKQIAELEGVDKFLTEEELDNGRTTIKANPEWYEGYDRWLARQPASDAVKKAMREIRVSLDNDLMRAHNRLARMSEMGDTAIQEFRTHIGHVHNYFPHHRYGNYFIQGKDRGGNIVYREHFDALHKRYARRHFEQRLEALKKDYPTAVFDLDENTKLPDEAFGRVLDPEAMEQVIKAALDKVSDKEQAKRIAEVLHESVADVMKSAGWGSHAIGRKNIPGFQKDDLFRVLYDYKSGLTGWLAKMEASRDFAEALGKINAKAHPQEWSYTSQYVKDMLRNSDHVDRTVGLIKSAAFAWYLGGNIKTAVLNLTQNVIVGVPRLQMDVEGGARAYIAAAQKQIVNQYARRFTGDKAKGLTEEEARLVQELYGDALIADAYMEEVRGQVMGGTSARVWNKFMKWMGYPMSVAERFNRGSLALAAFRAARDGKLRKKARERFGVRGEKATYEQARAFAEEVVRDSHFVYGKTNAHELLRSSPAGRGLGAAFTFKTFTANLLGLWSWALRTQGREGAIMVSKGLGATIAMGGLVSVPFYATLMAFSQAVSGDDDDWTELVRKQLPQNTTLRDIVCYGLPAGAGVNLGGSLKMELALTGGMQKGGTPREVLTEGLGDIIGIPWDMFVERPSRVMEAMRADNYWRAVEEVVPTAVSNGMKALRLATEGQKTIKGRDINDPGERGARKLSSGEAFGKLFGFQPVSATRSYDAYAASKHSDSVRADKADEVATIMVKALDARDSAEMVRARKVLKDWNAKMEKEGKPHMRILMKDVQKRVTQRRRQVRMTPKARQKGEAFQSVWG